MILNLTHSNKSDIHYQIDKFPDGEPTLTILSDLGQHVDDVTILTRITNTDELFILALACDILHRWEITYNIEISYLMTQRMDRVMSMNRPFSLKIMSAILYTLNAKWIHVHELHNPTIQIEGVALLPKMRTIQTFLNAFFPSTTQNDKFAKTFKQDICVVYPDNGAYQRYNRAISCLHPVIFHKIRDLDTGKIISITTETDRNTIKTHRPERFLIVDDLCDGGSTFVAVQKQLKEILPSVPIDIAVYHTVNEKGIRRLLDNFDNVYTTNSYYDWQTVINSEKLHVQEVI